MKQKWLEVQERFEALESRERILIAGAIIAVFFLLWDFSLTQPMKDEYVLLQARERAAQQAVTTSEAEKTVLETLSKKDPNELVKRELAQVEEKIDKLDQQLNELSAGLVKASDFPLVLRDLLLSSGGIELVTLHTLPPSPIELVTPKIEADLNDQAEQILSGEALSEAESKKPGIRLFRHDVKLIFEGGFHSVLNYIKNLEESDWQFYWESVDYKVTTYPIAQVTIRVFTLSADGGAHRE